MANEITEKITKVALEAIRSTDKEADRVIDILQYGEEGNFNFDQFVGTLSRVKAIEASIMEAAVESGIFKPEAIREMYNKTTAAALGIFLIYGGFSKLALRSMVSSEFFDEIEENLKLTLEKKKRATSAADELKAVDKILRKLDK